MGDELFGRDYDGPAFQLFSAEHLIPLAAIAAVCLLIALLAPRLSASASRRLGWGLALFAVANALGWEIW
jgi:hypothetical protein